MTEQLTPSTRLAEQLPTVGQPRSKIPWLRWCCINQAQLSNWIAEVWLGGGGGGDGC